MSMRYEDRPQSEVKVLGDNTFQSKDVVIGNSRIVRRDQYALGKFRVVEFYDNSGKLTMKSELVGEPPQYEYRIETYYDANGQVLYTVQYARTYDEYSNLLSEQIIR